MTETQAPYRTPVDNPLDKRLGRTPGAAFVCRLPYITCLDCECPIDADPPPPDMLCGTCRERADEAQRDHRVREAAHELLAALEGLMPFGWPCFCSERSGLHSRECQRALDAIAKARGGANE